MVLSLPFNGRCLLGQDRLNYGSRGDTTLAEHRVPTTQLAGWKRALRPASMFSAHPLLVARIVLWAAEDGPVTRSPKVRGGLYRGSQQGVDDLRKGEPVASTAPVWTVRNESLRL